MISLKIGVNADHDEVRNSKPDSAKALTFSNWRRKVVSASPSIIAACLAFPSVASFAARTKSSANHLPIGTGLLLP